MSKKPQILITQTDESPALASASLLPILRHFTKAASIDVAEIDISLAGRILRSFPDYLNASQNAELAKTPGLDELGDVVRAADTRLIKLPNASATENQLIDAVKELQSKGYNLPDYPSEPKTTAEKEIKERYDAQTGSVVNPVMRQGNAVRSIPAAVKDAARRNPHAMGEWLPTSKTRVAHMDGNDFYATEESVTEEYGDHYSIRFVNAVGQETTLLKNMDVSKGDIIDTAVMRRAPLNQFLEDAMQDAKDNDLLLSLHLKATMMKKTDGVAFGDAVTLYFKDVFDKYGQEFEALDINPENGIEDLLNRIKSLDLVKQGAIKADIQKSMDEGAPLAMANPSEGLSHLSSPNLVIVDVSMANLARWGGELQDQKGDYKDTLAVIPDSTYARMHQVGIDVLKNSGNADPKTMGTVTTIRLQAEGAEEYGSKSTSFEAKEDGAFIVTNSVGQVVNRQDVSKGDLWRLCKTTDVAVQNWLGIADEYATTSKKPVIFWLDSVRPHDREMIRKVNCYFDARNNNTRNIKVLSPEDAMAETLTATMRGEDRVCATGNLIGDHITDYFPILEVGHSSKMLSVIKLLNGGLVAETGSGGTAPDLLGFVERQNHFLWNGTGSALALVEAFQHIADTENNIKAKCLGDALDRAATRYVADEREPSLPSSDDNGLDTRQSHYYMALYWAQELAQQNMCASLRQEFTKFARDLEQNKEQILSEIEQTRGEGKGFDIGGRYAPSLDRQTENMRPSPTLNRLIPA